jgi:hypothetical protein
LFVVLFPFAIELLLEEKKRQSAAQAVCHADPNHPCNKNVWFPHFLKAGWSEIDRFANMQAAL